MPVAYRSGQRQLMEVNSDTMNSEVDVNILIKNYHAKISSLINQNILLESKLESLTQDYIELQKQAQTEDFQEQGIE